MHTDYNFFIIWIENESFFQLTTYDEDEWNSDNLTVMRKTQNLMDSKMQQAHDWLQDPEALHGGVGEKSVRQVLLYR